MCRRHYSRESMFDLSCVKCLSLQSCPVHVIITLYFMFQFFKPALSLKMTCAKLVLSLAIVVALACDVASAYRVHVSKGGDYSLPTIPGYPTPTKTFPGRDRGLPPYYQGVSSSFRMYSQ